MLFCRVFRPWVFLLWHHREKGCWRPRQSLTRYFQTTGLKLLLLIELLLTYRVITYISWLINQLSIYAYCVKTLLIRNCYRTMPSAIRDLFSDFIIFCKIGVRNKENICQYCTRQHEITTLSLNACWNRIQELSDLLINFLLNMI